MFSIALIVFREVMEISIILGIILAATKGVKGRGLWAWAGIAAGITGAGIVAFFINEISGFAQGIGQEVFNAAILITASAVIGWTVLWMRANARTMVAKMKNVGKQVQAGETHLVSISIIIALAFLREGSEIALFGNGVLISGQITIAQFLSGAALGLGGGSIIGAMLYFGMLKMSPKHIFQVTGWLLIFLAAGMMSVAANYLVSAGVINTLTQTMWDSSAILPDTSILGRFLGVVIGYTAMPMGIQLVFYITTLFALTYFAKMIDSKTQKNLKTPLI